MKLSANMVLMILLLSTLSQITAEMYVPALPIITSEYKTTNFVIQFSLAIFFAGFSISTFLYGPLSDQIGRRPPILSGALLNIIGSFICLIAPDLFLLILGRLVQGVGVGACNCVTRSLSRDLLHGHFLAKFSSQMWMIAAIVTALAPTLGGYFIHYLSWRFVFFFLFVYSTLVWLYTLRHLPETNLDLNPQAMNLRKMLSNYKTLIQNKTFIGFTLCSSFASAGLIVYGTLAPFLLQNILKLTPVEFGWLSFLIAGAIFLGSYINNHLVSIKSIRFLMLLSVNLMLGAGFLMIMLQLFGYLNVFVIMLPVFLFYMGTGLTFANAFSGAFHALTKDTGSAAALYGCIQTLISAIASFAVALIPQHNQLPLSFSFALLALLSLTSLKYLINIKKFSLSPHD